eukprot:Phypoly_transcript_06041.p1 GENE.Phypoly_transcript_06041~~Phypoly_transcript_06041.p1  ORF type:complete len:489 (+),score=46.38 Phypoly_transcript_06041:121-1587(+)
METESRSAHMRIHSMGRKEFGCLFVVFFVLFLICIIIGVTGPDARKQLIDVGYTCPEGVTSYDPSLCSGVDISNNMTWEGMIEDMTPFNQQLELKIEIQNKLFQQKDVKAEVTFVVDILKQERNSNVFSPLITNDTHPRKIECNKDAPTCVDIILVRIVSLKYEAYEFRVSSNYYATSNSSDFFGDVIYILEFGNDVYSKFELAFRMVFLGISIAVVIYFAYATKHIPWKHWTLEQQWTLGLLLGLVGYNNPFFTINVAVGGWFVVFLDELLLVSFVSMLLFFWIIMYDGIRTDGMQKGVGFYLPKILVVGLFWVSGNIVYSWFSLHQILDPVYSTDITANPGFVFFSVVFAVVAVAYVFYVLWTIGKAYQHSRTIPMLSFRLKALGVFSGLVIIAVAVGVVFNFVGSRSTDTSQFLTYLGLFNLYVYLLTYAFLPAPHAGATQGVGGMTRLKEEKPTDAQQPPLHDPAEEMDVIFLEDAMQSNKNVI